jgi:hypothetical protein
LEKYKRMNGNRMLFYTSTSQYWMFAAGNRTGYNAAAMSRIANVNLLRTTDKGQYASKYGDPLMRSATSTKQGG